MRFFVVLLLAGVVVAPLDALADSLEVPDCVEVSKSAPYVAYGHNHVVRVSNQCEREVHCEVSTDATPTPHHLELDAGESRELLTRRGSPSSVFEVNVQCEEQR